MRRGRHHGGQLVIPSGGVGRAEAPVHSVAYERKFSQGPHHRCTVLRRLRNDSAGVATPRPPAPHRGDPLDFGRSQQAIAHHPWQLTSEHALLTSLREMPDAMRVVLRKPMP